MNELKKNKLNDQEMENVSGGDSLSEFFDVAIDIGSDEWGPFTDTGGTVVDVSEPAWITD